MKKVTILLVVFFLLLLVSACKKNETQSGQQTARTQQAAVKNEEAANKEENGPVNADKNCSKAYNFMKAFVEQMEQQMAKMGKQPPQKKEFPPKDKFVKACKDLPAEIIRCLDMEYSTKHQQECQDAKKNADPEKMKKFEEALK